MKEKVTEVFTEITMPEEAETRIRQAMADKQAKPRPLSPVRRMAAAAAILVLVLALSPRVRAAVESLAETIVFRDGLTLRRGSTPEGDSFVEVTYDTEAPSWAQLREGRIFFLGNGQEIDITDQITEAEPYFYTYTDENGYVHFLWVGYSGSLENHGVYEFIQKPDGTWLTGAGRNFLDPEEQIYPWVKVVWEQQNIPWPMPGEDFAVDVEKNPNGEAEQAEIKRK